MYSVIEIFNADEKEKICRAVLADLPEWFGIPDATEEYCLGVRNKTFLAAVNGRQTVGFVSLHNHNEYTSEIHVIGIYKSFRNKGIGSLLINSIVKLLSQQKKQYLTVKTLDGSRESKAYEETRKFYLAKGFIPLEVFPTLWGKENPCLFMIKKIEE
ncbi:MAG: GNAT family N-acetyltransferase [Candidatus Cloacimonetes bacterium]|nr:GNAT family N-acetyltransferase [Candidatus Cloacimonadota bacterium]